jgi:hypothetical protein
MLIVILKRIILMNFPCSTRGMTPTQNPKCSLETNTLIGMHLMEQKVARVPVFNFSCTMDPLVPVGLLLILKKTLRVIIVHFVCNYIKMSYKIKFKFLHLINVAIAKLKPKITNNKLNLGTGYIKDIKNQILTE